MKTHLVAFAGGVVATLLAVLVATTLAQPRQTTANSVDRRSVFAAAAMTAALVHQSSWGDADLDGMIKRSFEIADRAIEKHP